MPKFNLAIVAVWLAIFFCSLYNTSGMYPADAYNASGIRWVMLNVVYNFNETVWTNCHWCGVSDEPVRVATGITAGNETLYTTQDEYGSLADNRLTVKSCGTPCHFFSCSCWHWTSHSMPAEATSGGWVVMPPVGSMRGSGVNKFSSGTWSTNPEKKPRKETR